jgi:hypothetical protein
MSSTLQKELPASSAATCLASAVVTVITQGRLLGAHLAATVRHTQ